jgi:hypothetical protein
MPRTVRPILRLGGTKGPYLSIPIDADLYDTILGMEWACEDCLAKTFQAILRQGIEEVLEGSRGLEDKNHI